MIAVERPAPESEAEPELALAPAPAEPASAPATSVWFRPVAGRLSRRVYALVLVAAVLAAAEGGFGVVDTSIAVGLQGRAAALHQHWSAMRLDGVPDSDLAALEQEWAFTQSTTLLGVGAVFWSPRAGSIIDRWQAQSDAIWARDLSLYRASALAAEQNLHRMLGSETRTQRKARVDALAAAATPADYAALRADWGLEARLIPLDARIAQGVSAIGKQAAQATTLGIRSDPSANLLAMADGYTRMDATQRMARAELLTRSLISVGADLQGRLDAATVTKQAFTNATNQISVASLYGIDLSGYQGRIDVDKGAFANAAAVAEFNRITADLNQIVSTGDNAINAALAATHIISGVSFIYQSHPLSCEEAATSMALTHQGINLSQETILAELGADRHAAYTDSSGRLRWGNPYQTFVGNVNGSEYNLTGYGTYWPPLVRIAKSHGARIIDYGSMSAATVYARLIAGHPVVVFATWDWAWHPRHDYLSFDGTWIPFIGPYAASHVYTAVGISAGSVLVNDPIRGQYWVSKAAFQAAYSDFNEAIVFA
jgi:uncharacterized protein YvpB